MRRENHLRTPNEFSFVYRTGRRSRTDSVVAVIATAASAPQATPKVGFATSRRTGNAVRRNRARRRLRAVVDPLVENLAPGSMIVLQATPETASAAFAKLEADVRAALAGAIHA